MKKYLIPSLLVALSLFTGCNKKTHSESNLNWKSNNGKLKVLTTTTIILDTAREILGDRVDIISLICGDLDPHSYELVKGDDEKIAHADLILYNGLGLEHGQTLRSNLEGNPKAVGIGDVLLKDNPSPVLIIDNQYDPHIWMDVSLWMRTIDPIIESITKLDPNGADFYQQNGNALKQKMATKDQEIFTLMQKIPQEKRYLVTTHDAFNYFARRYLVTPEEKEKGLWKSRVASPEGLSPESELGIADIYSIINLVENRNIVVLFPETNLSRDSLKKIVIAGNEKGLTLRLSQESLQGDTCSDEKEGYFHMIEKNADIILRELSQ